MVVEYKLRTPIEVGEEVIEILKLEEPNAGKLVDYGVSFEEHELTSAKGMVAMVNACSINTTPIHVSKMKLRDLTGAIEACADFFG